MSTQRLHEALQHGRQHLLRAHAEQVVALGPGLVERQHLDAEELREALRHRGRQHRHAQAGLDELRDRVEAAHLQPRLQRAALALGLGAHQLVRGRASVQADDVVVEQLLETHAGHLGENMAGRHHRRQRAVPVAPGAEPVVEQRGHEDADVGTALGHRRLHLGAGLVFEADADLRVALRQLLEEGHAFALTHAFPEYSERGVRSLSGSPVLYLSEEAHHSFTKIAHMTGLGRNVLRAVSADSDLKLDLAALRRQVETDRKNGHLPFMVVGTCGTTAAGVIDPLPALHAYCKSEGLWLHVDAAWGGAAALSPALRPHVAGIELADSITCDAHKWFSVPMACGMFFCRHQAAVLSTFHAQTAYMPLQHSDDVLDSYTSTVQWSRRFIGLKLFMSLAHNGSSGYAAMIEHQARMGDLLRERLAQSGWQIVNRTPLPVVCFTRPGLDIPSLLVRLKHEQIAWMSETRCGGQPVLRACVTSFKTSEEDVLSVVDGLNRIEAR